MHIQKLSIFLFISFLFFGSNDLFAQQLDQIGKKGGIKLDGGINVNQLYRTNASSGVDPYSMVVSGQLGLSVYGLSAPLTFTWSNSKFTATQPFNQFALSPSYKWATLHLGWSSMSFSSYSISGHTFAGVGTDLRPNDQLSVSAFYGRLRKELNRDTVWGIEPQYRRVGTGVKTTYRLKIGEVGMHLFHASDDEKHAMGLIDTYGVTPMDNLVVGTFFNLRPSQSISVQAEVSNSSLSKDKRISKAIDQEGDASLNNWAIKSNVAFNLSIGSVGAGIEYVEPNYQTLGAYYTLNDFVNYTLNFATVLLKGKVSLATDIGLRENNLSKESDTKQKDVIQNVNVNFSPNKKLNFNISYSNFYNYTHIQTVFEEENAHTQYDLLDTLKFTQINQSVNIATSWKIKESESSKQSLNCNVNFQQSSQEQSDTPDQANSKFLNGSLGYNWNLPKSKFGLGLNTNYSRNDSPGSKTEAIGPVLSLRKSFFEKKMRARFSLSWNGTYADGESTGNVMTSRLGGNYTLRKKHQFNLNIAYSRRERSGKMDDYLTASLGYSYRFSLPGKKDNQKKGSL